MRAAVAGATDDATRASPNFGADRRICNAFTPPPPTARVRPHPREADLFADGCQSIRFPRFW
jgi:hypothetical protein